MNADELLAKATKAPAPGTPEWVKVMTASKVAALPGHSPYESRYSLWHRMAGNLPPSQPDDEVLQRGRILEPACAAWYSEQHPEVRVINPVDLWWCSAEGAATPDRVLVFPDGSVRILECKTSAKDWEWGEPGTDAVPADYFDQSQWIMHCTGTDVVHLVVLTNGLQFREYVVHRDQQVIDRLVALVRDFLDTVERGEAPGISVEDGHTATYHAVRELHPDIEDAVAVLDFADVTAYLDALADKAEAETRLQAAKNRCAHTIGDAKAGDCYGRRIFNRQTRKGGTPYLVQARNLPTIPELTGDEERAA